MSGDEREQFRALAVIRFALVLGVLLFALVTFGQRYIGEMQHEDPSAQNLLSLRYALWVVSAFAVGWAFYWKARMESARSLEEVRRALILGWTPGEVTALLGGVIYFNGGPPTDFVFGFVAFVVVLALLRIPTPPR